jgi:ankyrin repeat protein
MRDSRFGAGPAAIHLTNENNWTPLHGAANEGQLEVVELLLDNGMWHSPVRTVCRRKISPLELFGRRRGHRSKTSPGWRDAAVCRSPKGTP